MQFSCICFICGHVHTFDHTIKQIKKSGISSAQQLANDKAKAKAELEMSVANALEAKQKVAASAVAKTEAAAREKENADALEKAENVIAESRLREAKRAAADKTRAKAANAVRLKEEEHHRKKAEKEAAKQALKDAKDAKKVAENTEKERLAEEVMAINAGSDYPTSWHRKQAVHNAKKASTLRMAEAIKEAVMLQAAEKAAKKTAFQEGYFAHVEQHTRDITEAAIPTDDMLRRRNSARRVALRKFNPGAAGASIGSDTSGTFRESVFDPEGQFDQFVSVVKLQEKKDMFSALQEGADLDLQLRSGEGNVAVMYVEVLRWTFFNQKYGKKFVGIMGKLMDDKQQAEGYYQLFQAPNSAEGNLYDPSARVTYITVGVGSTDQYVALHTNTDLRAIINEDKTKQLAHQAGIKEVAGTFYCIKEPAPVKRIITDWNTEDYCKMRFVVVPNLSIFGGSGTFSRFLQGTKDAVMSFKISKSPDIMVTDDLLKQLRGVREEYKKVAPDIGAAGMFKGIKAPLDFDALIGETQVHSFGLLGASWLAQAHEASEASVVEGVTTEEFFFGPGASSAQIAAYVANGDGRFVLADLWKSE
jgi:hypothetical protein